MPERMVQFDEHMLERDRRTFARIQGLLQSDPFYKRFQKQSSLAPQRGDAPAEKESKQAHLLRTYLSGITRMAGIFREKLEPRVVENTSQKRLPEGYVRAERAQREALDQDFDEREEFARMTGDKRERVKEWLERLTLPDHYTPAFQYLLWRTLIRESDSDTVNPLPQFHEMAVGMLEELILAHDRAQNGNEWNAVNRVFADNPFFAEKENDAQWKNRAYALVRDNRIAELYDELAKLVTAVEEFEGDVRGRWVIYSKDGIIDERGRFLERGDGARMLRDASAQSPWCLGRYATAQSYLARGPVHVFLTYTKKGERPAFGIALDGNGVAYEARGADDSQDLAPQFAAIADERLSKTPGGENYRERLDAANALAEAARFLGNPRLKPYEELSPEGQEDYRRHLRTVYELDRKLIGFGYRENTYARKMRQRRSAVQDAGVLFGTIAQKPRELSAQTDAYIGELSKEFFHKLDELPHERLATLRLYTKFSEEPVSLKDIMLGVGPKEGEEFGNAIQEKLDVQDKHMQVSNYARSMLKNEKFIVAKEQIPANLVVLSVTQLGFPNGATYQEIKDAATKKFGLKLCPPEVGPQLRLAYTDQPEEEFLVIAMEPITVSGWFPGVFNVYCHFGKRGLSFDSIDPDFEWRAKSRFVFLRK